MAKAKVLNWNEFYALALKNYNRGGDGFVECYTEEDYQEFYPNGLTEKQALEEFAKDYDMELDSAGYWGY